MSSLPATYIIFIIRWWVRRGWGRWRGGGGWWWRRTAFLIVFLYLLGELLLVFFTLIPHHKAIFFIHLHSFLVNLWLVLSKFLKESTRELLPSLTSSPPNSLKVSNVAEILCDCNCMIQVQYSMPPIWGHEYCFSRVLDSLNNYWQLTRSLGTILLL